MRKTAAILLAAGESKRMGEPKQLIAFRGKPLVAHALDEILNSGIERVLVVLGAHHEGVSAVLQGKSAELYWNREWQRGMGESIRVGLYRAQEVWPEAEAVVVCLTDQPFLEGAHYARLLQAAEEHPHLVIAAKFEGCLAEAAVFPRAFFSVLQGLEGDKGAGKWLRSNPKFVMGMEMAEAGRDWDRPRDIFEG